MNPYIEKLKAYFAENEPNYGMNGVHSMLEFLFWNYTEYNPILNGKIREGFREVDQYFSHLTVRENDAVLNCFLDLCLEHERMAFNYGFQAGFLLAEELGEMRQKES